MSAGLRASTIERFRYRSHGDSTLRLLALSPDGQSLLLARTCTKGFLVGRDFDTAVGAYVSTLVIQTGLSGSNHDEIGGISFVDLVYPSGSFQRFRLETDTVPQLTDDRYVINLHAAFGDTRPIDGLIIINPTPPSPVQLPLLTSVTFVQAAPATVWTIDHNLGHYPIVELFDQSNEIIEGYVTNPTVNRTVVTFTVAVAGSARCV